VTEGMHTAAPSSGWGSGPPGWGERSGSEGEWRRAWRRHPPFHRNDAALEEWHDPHVRTPKLARLEAALLVADAPLSARKLAQVAALADAGEVRELVERLNTLLERSQATFRVERVSSGYRLLTLPAFAAWLDRLHHRQAHLRLSPPMMETLAIVAYRQPVTRADLEAVRGVQCAEILKQLMERGLVKIVGEHDSLGRPYLYGTTRQFLELYGLTSLDDLPMAEALRRPATQPVGAPREEAEDAQGPAWEAA
jgi:segregation and condensation protein B